MTARHVKVLKDSTTILLGPTTIISYDQTVAIIDRVSLAADDTIDFIVHGAERLDQRHRLPRLRSRGLDDVTEGGIRRRGTFSSGKDTHCDASRFPAGWRCTQP
jgi:hypothetical protein